MWPFKKIAKDLYLLDQVQQRLAKKIPLLESEIEQLRDELGLEPKIVKSFWQLGSFHSVKPLKARISKLEEQNRLLLDYLKVKVTEIQGTPTKKVLTKVGKK